MVLALDAHVISGVEVEEEELLAECEGSNKLKDLVLGRDVMVGPLVEGEGKEGVDEEGEGNGRVLEVMEMVRRDGPVGVEGLVAVRANEELHGDGEGAAKHDQVEFEAP